VQGQGEGVAVKKQIKKNKKGAMVTGPICLGPQKGRAGGVGYNYQKVAIRIKIQGGKERRPGLEGGKLNEKGKKRGEVCNQAWLSAICSKRILKNPTRRKDYLSKKSGLNENTKEV